MKSIRPILLSILIALPLALLAGEGADWPEIDGALHPAPNQLVAGQPQPHELVAFSHAGVRHVINARTERELEAWDEPRLLDELGMAYHHLPIGGPDDLDRAAIQRFDEILSEIGDEPVLLHCASGNRIGALFALRAAWIDGKDSAEAMEIGRAHGLTRLEGVVREKLGEQRSVANAPDQDCPENC